MIEFWSQIIQPVTTRAKRGPYRQHSDEFKRAAVARTLVADASVSRIARELNINTNQLFSWRKRVRMLKMLLIIKNIHMENFRYI
jgi:transposase-like protein